MSDEMRDKMTDEMREKMTDEMRVVSFLHAAGGVRAYAESPLQIVVNGRAALTIMTHVLSSQEREQLVLGVLFTERVIASADEVESMIVSESQVSVVTRTPYAILLSRKTVLAGCGGASSFLDSGALGTVSCGEGMSEEVCAGAVLSVPVSCWFSAGLFSAEGRVLLCVEDISAQNVFDSVVGYFLRERLSPAGLFVVLLGNCTVESMRKLIIAKIPVLMVVGAVTEAAARAADEAGVRVFLR